MEYVIISAVSLVLGIFGGGYLGYKYGRKIELRAQTELNKLASQVRVVRL